MDPNNVDTTQPQEDTKPVETEAKPAEATQTKPEETTTDKPAEEKSVAETLGVKKEQPTKSVKPDTVPFGVFEDVKNELRDIKKKLDEKNEVVAPSDLKELSEKYNVSLDFMKDLSDVIDKKQSAKYEAEISGLKEKDRQIQIDKAFKSAFDRAMANLPEYAGVVNENVIKKLSLDPENSSKTFTQIIKETYGNALTGRKPLETTRPGETKNNDVDVDIQRAKTDAAYFKEVMADPDKKKIYNEHMSKHIRL